MRNPVQCYHTHSQPWAQAYKHRKKLFISKVHQNISTWVVSSSHNKWNWRKKTAVWFLYGLLNKLKNKEKKCFTTFELIFLRIAKLILDFQDEGACKILYKKCCVVVLKKNNAFWKLSLAIKTNVPIKTMMST